MSIIDLLASGTKGDLLRLMKNAGSLSLDEAMAATGLARTTLREHLLQLERDGFIRKYAERTKGRGRPSHRYEITEEGDRFFPRRDGVLLRELIAFLQKEGEEELVASFFESFWNERTQEVRRRLGEVRPDDERERLEVLAEILREQGFMPEIKRGSSGLVIRECNCPFPEAVKQSRLPCRLEAQFYEAIFETPAKRVSYIPDGHSACTYEFPPEPESPARGPQPANE